MSPESNRSRNFSASFASRLPLSSASCLSFVGFSCMNAISAPENMAESTMQTTIRMYRRVLLIDHTPYVVLVVDLADELFQNILDR